MSSKQIKSIPFFHMKAADEGRSRTGIAAVMGNIDAGGDRIHPGAFTKTIQEGSVRYKHLWGHNWGQPPTAAIKELREIPRNELPAEVLEYAPEATGGLLVTREYFKSDLCDLILQAIDAGAMEMSIGYDAKQTEYSELDDGSRIRELKEIQLLETSDVPFGMNAATTAAFAKALIDQVRPLGAIAHELELYIHNIKAGARNSAHDIAVLTSIHKNVLDLGFDKCKLIDETDGKSVTTDNQGPEAESATHSNSLLANELKVNDLRLSQLLRSENYVSTGRKAERISG